MPRDVQEPVPSKFVIRKLPPELTEDAFGATLRNLCKDELDWFRYHPGSSGESGIATSTAFIKLRHPELAPVLKQVLQNSPFIGDHGVPYHCEMEVAIYQRIPKERAKEDPYVATYDQDPYYKDFLKEMERDDEAAKKGPTITATTTIPEEASEKELIVTPLMSYVINRYTKTTSGRARNGKGSSGDGREKENRKRLQVIPEKQATAKSAPAEAPVTGKAAPGKRGRGFKKEEKPSKGKTPPSDAAASGAEKQQEASHTVLKTAVPAGKGGRGKGAKGQSRAGSAGGGGVAAGPATAPSATTAADGTPVVISTADVAAARSAAQAAARVAMQMASGKSGPLSTAGKSGPLNAVLPSDGAAKNGSVPNPAKGPPKRPRTGRRARGRGGGGALEGEGAAAATQDDRSLLGHYGNGGHDGCEAPLPGLVIPALHRHRVCLRVQEQPQGGETQATSASDRAIAAAAAAASAALQDSALGERPRPRARPAFGARGVRDALSRAGIKQPAGRGGARNDKAGGSGAASASAPGDGRGGDGEP